MYDRFPVLQRVNQGITPAAGPVLGLDTIAVDLKQPPGCVREGSRGLRSNSRPLDSRLGAISFGNQSTIELMALFPA